MGERPDAMVWRASPRSATVHSPTRVPATGSAEHGHDGSPLLPNRSQLERGDGLGSEDFPSPHHPRDRVEPIAQVLDLLGAHAVDRRILDADAVDRGVDPRAETAPLADLGKEELQQYSDQARAFEAFRRALPT